MKRLIVSAVALVFMLSGMAWCAEKNLDQWLKSVSGKLSSSSKAKKHKETSVAGVKGAEEKSGEDLYWKKGSVPEAEADEFSKAVTLVEAGKNAEAIVAFENFKKKYPASQLTRDADDGLKFLKGSAEEKTPSAK
ncbi:hypothetical protein EPN18_03190 [bacterium]|nr:MAG: hypothetical protein EPN18_03190 [bacterium]